MRASRLITCISSSSYWAVVWHRWSDQRVLAYASDRASSVWLKCRLARLEHRFHTLKRTHTGTHADLPRVKIGPLLLGIFIRHS